MSRLPFVVEPKRKPIIEDIGSEESGKIQIQRKGYLTSGEKAFVQSALSGDNSTLLIVGLARKVGNRYGYALDYAYNKVVELLSGSAKDEQDKKIEVDFLDDFSNIMNQLSTMTAKEKIINAFCLLKYRVNPEITLDDVFELHPDIIDGIHLLYNDEELKSVDRLDPEFRQNEKQVEMTSEKEVLELEKKPNRRKING
jgi:hypothetical protein